MAGLAPSMEILLRAYFAAIWKIRPQGSRRKATRNMHQALAQAIADRDPNSARALMSEMLELNVNEIDDLAQLCEKGLAAADGATSDAHSRRLSRSAFATRLRSFCRPEQRIGVGRPFNPPAVRPAEAAPEDAG
jgi:hypothetical protein